MSKPNRGKTQTIKKRAIYVYLPTQQMVGAWKALAEKAGASISKFVIDRVEDSLRREEGEEEGYLSRLDLIKKLTDADHDLYELKRENGMLKKLAENLDTELKRYRAKPFADDEKESFQGVRSFDKELIDLLRKGRSYNQDEILSHLGIDLSDSTLVRSISRQLELLEDYALVEYSGRGWRWRG